MATTIDDKNPESSRTSTKESVDSTYSWSSRMKSATTTVIHHARKHTGVGIVCAVAYFDPGNWGVDLQAGSQFGYRLLFVVLLAGIFAVFLQVLASRLGCVTGLDLASHCRLLLHSRPKHTRLYRWLGLYPLYVLSEIAIIATDLAELLGSAIALCMLFPRLELWHGVLITAFDVVFLLAMKDPLRGKPVRLFEVFIAVLVIAVLVCMCIIIARIDVHWGHAFEGYLPSKYIFKSGGLYTSVGILGATVMPHSLFLGSALATQDRIEFKEAQRRAAQSQTSSVSSTESPVDLKEKKSFFKTIRQSPLDALKTYFTNLLAVFKAPPPSSYSTRAVRHSDRENNCLGFVKAHIYHGTVDMMVSLLGFAVGINSLILILASAVFFYGQGSNGAATEAPASLFDAYDLIRDLVGQSAATLFAIALLAAGQSSSIIATVAGQAVSEGFLNWRVSPVVRRFLTRILAIIPSMIVAIAVGRRGIDTLLVASQVVLSVVLPFITFPLLWCTSSKAIMTVYEEGEEGILPSSEATDAAGDNVEAGPQRKSVDYSNNKLVIGIGMSIWLLVLTANVYVLVSLAMGNEG